MNYLAQVSIILCLLGFETLQAQNAIPAAGGDASGTGGSVSYTVGQVIYTSLTGSSGTTIQGCQQPYDIFILTGTPEGAGIQVDFTLYPNPSSDRVKLTVGNPNPKNLSYRLYNNNSILIQSKKITGKETMIEMGEFPPAPYYLHITDNLKEIRTFIIIKN